LQEFAVLVDANVIDEITLEKSLDLQKELVVLITAKVKHSSFNKFDIIHIK
jgi:hypothetical protein